MISDEEETESNKTIKSISSDISEAVEKYARLITGNLQTEDDKIKALSESKIGIIAAALNAIEKKFDALNPTSNLTLNF